VATSNQALMRNPGQGMKRRILFLMMQPPGGTGVQGLRYSKLYPYTLGSEWEFHFSGPSPQLTSITLEPLVCPLGRCHYTDNVSFSARFATLKNRQPKHSFSYYLYGLLQLGARQVEKLIAHDSFDFLRRGILDVCRRADDIFDFDLIAAKSPDFRLLEVGAQLARERGKPLLAIYDDPHGQRDNEGFYPDDRSRQIDILEQARGVLFMSPLTRDRYVEQGLVRRDKTFCLTDSYPLDSCFYPAQLTQAKPDAFGKVSFNFVHLGNLPEWRPINPLLDALGSLQGQHEWHPLHISLYGYVYPAAIELIESNPNLASCFTIRPAVGHIESHLVAEQADVLLVMIGSRHLDNQPSKFFVYLGHPKPLVVIGPPGNPIQALVEELQVGVFCDVNNQASIQEGLKKITANYQYYAEAFKRNSTLIERYRADVVAVDLLTILDAVIAPSGDRGI
jgi:hypothetical protein